MKWQVSSNFQIYLGKSDDEPPISNFHDNYRLNFSDFQLYQVTLPIDPPHIILKQELYIVFAKQYQKTYCEQN